MAVNFLGAVFVRVTNLDQSLRFYSDVLGLQLRNIEDCGRIANYIISENSPLITLIKTESLHIGKYPIFNLNCNNVLELYKKFITQEVKVGSINNWSSEMNVHIDFDVYDPDGNVINLIEWRENASG